MPHVITSLATLLCSQQTVYTEPGVSIDDGSSGTFLNSNSSDDQLRATTNSASSRARQEHVSLTPLAYSLAASSLVARHRRVAWVHLGIEFYLRHQQRVLLLLPRSCFTFICGNIERLKKDQLI